MQPGRGSHYFHSHGSGRLIDSGVPYLQLIKSGKQSCSTCVIIINRVNRREDKRTKLNSATGKLITQKTEYCIEKKKSSFNGEFMHVVISLSVIIM